MFPKTESNPGCLSATATILNCSNLKRPYSILSLPNTRGGAMNTPSRRLSPGGHYLHGRVGKRLAVVRLLPLFLVHIVKCRPTHYSPAASKTGPIRASN
jgi:hypothetical protein